MGEGVARLAPVAIGRNQPVLGLDHFRRRVEPQRLGVAAKIGHRDEQVERLTLREQARSALVRRHRVERVEQQAGEQLTPKGRFEPARADEMRQFGVDLGARFRFDQRVDGGAAAPRRQPGQRHCPHLGKARFRRLERVDQRLDVRRIEP